MTVGVDMAAHSGDHWIVCRHAAVEVEPQRLAHVSGPVLGADVIRGGEVLCAYRVAEALELVISLVADRIVEFLTWTDQQASGIVIRTRWQARDQIRWLVQGMRRRVVGESNYFGAPVDRWARIGVISVGEKDVITAVQEVCRKRHTEQAVLAFGGIDIGDRGDRTLRPVRGVHSGDPLARFFGNPEITVGPPGDLVGI